MHRVILRVRDAATLKADEDFLMGLQFSRLYNALNSSIRSFYAIMEEGPSQNSDRIQRVLSHGAVVAECLATIEKHHCRIERLQCWSADEEHVLAVKALISERGSFYWTVLKTIRDKIMYHYDLSVIRDIIHDFPIADGQRFGEAESPGGADLCFPLIDEMVVHYLVKRYDHERPELEVFDEIVDKLTGTIRSTL